MRDVVGEKWEGNRKGRGKGKEKGSRVKILAVYKVGG